jgi:hypothetical protein
VLRKAFKDTGADPEFIAEADRLKLAINLSSGEEVENIFRAAAQTDKSLINEMVPAREN